MRRPLALMVMDEFGFRMAYGPSERTDIAERVELLSPHLTREQVTSRPEVLARAEVLLSSWGAPVMDETFLRAAPRLKAVFYAAGAVGGFFTQAAWERGIQVTSAQRANSIPVAEYTVSAIVMSLKDVWRQIARTRDRRRFVSNDHVHGCYGTKVGLVSLGVVARLVAELLRGYEVEVLAYDPFVSSAEAADSGVRLVGLGELFRECHVVSLHTPHLAETEGLVSGELIASMREGATLINTARGRVVDEPAMIRVLQRRTDLMAVLDVTWPEPPEENSPLWTMDNVVITPHLAGSAGAECQRLGRCMVEELDRYITGEPLRWQVRRSAAEWSSHRPAASVRV